MQMITTRNTAIVAPPAMLAVSNITRCREAVTKKKKLVVTFLTKQAASFAYAHRSTRAHVSRKWTLKGRKEGVEREREIGGGSFRIHIVTERVIHTRHLMAV